VAERVAGDYFIERHVVIESNFTPTIFTPASDVPVNDDGPPERAEAGDLRTGPNRRARTTT
jgi:hypothetical protein